MPIRLEEERTRIPSVKFRRLGEQLRYMVVKVDQEVVTEFQSKTPVLKADGSPRKQLVVTAMVLDGTTAHIKDGDSTRPAVPGELIRRRYKGRAWGTVIEARKPLGAYEVGDVHLEEFVSADIDAGQGRYRTLTTDEEIVNARSDGKVVMPTHTVKARRAKPEEWALVAQAEEHYHALVAAARTPIPAEPAATRSAVLDDDDF